LYGNRWLLSALAHDCELSAAHRAQQVILAPAAHRYCKVCVVREDCEMMSRYLGGLALTAVLLVWSLQPLSAQDFFAGKTITISTFTPPGGSYDTYARLLARHVGRFIPGRPTVIVLNQPGAGGLVALNYAGKVAPRDGTFLTLVGVGTLLQEAIGGQGMQVSLREFRWIGNFSKVNNAVAVWRTSRTKTIEDAKRQEVLLGSVGVGSIDAQLPAAFNVLLGTRFKVVFGYAGSKEVMLAAERGEVEGKLNGWSSFKAEFPGERLSNLNVLLQMGLTADLDLPQVPLFTDMVKGDPQKEAVAQFLSLTMAISRPLAAAPEVPSDRVVLLRRAFDAALKSPEFLSEAQRSGFDINPMTGEDVQDGIERILNAPKDVIARSKAAIETPTR
jgi:tripartite-type tricarboxylate transporter receptor subunit TctC